jgi:hypothetical protein
MARSREAAIADLMCWNLCHRDCCRPSPANNMQPESSHTSPDAPIPQSSPTLPAYRHHTQPTPTIEPSNALNATGLRQRRGVSPGHDSEIGSASASGSGSGTTRDPDVIRIQIQTPLSESSGVRKELTIERSLSVRELKDCLASGRWNQGESEGVRWVRDGMRLVWRGRIVKDEEVLGDVVKDVSLGTSPLACC